MLSVTKSRWVVVTGILRYCATFSNYELGLKLSKSCSSRKYIDHTRTQLTRLLANLAMISISVAAVGQTTDSNKVPLQLAREVQAKY